MYVNDPCQYEEILKKDNHGTSDNKSDFDTCWKGITINIQDKQVLK